MGSGGIWWDPVHVETITGPITRVAVVKPDVDQMPRMRALCTDNSVCTCKDYTWTIAPAKSDDPSGALTDGQIMVNTVTVFKLSTRKVRAKLLTF